MAVWELACQKKEWENPKEALRPRDLFSHLTTHPSHKTLGIRWEAHRITIALALIPHRCHTHPTTHHIHSTQCIHLHLTIQIQQTLPQGMLHLLLLQQNQQPQLLNLLDLAKPVGARSK
ncbi:hypothetical protein A1395_31620 [Pseudomonas protegens]|nr:hypothetical protein A1395_31620 [Pseudomonas protegens]